MEWYLPITILPGIGLLILSTSNLLIALNNEIRSLQADAQDWSEVIYKKIAQLRRLNLSLVGLYITAFFFVISGILSATEDNIIEQKLSSYMFVFSVILLAISLSLLITYSVKSIRIRERFLKEALQRRWKNTHSF